MPDGGWRYHASFWLDEYSRRWVQRRADRMSPRASHRWVRALEIAGQPQLEINFDHPPDGEGPPIQTHTLAPSAYADLPADPTAGLPPTGQWWRPVRVHQLSDVVIDVRSGLMFHGDKVLSQSGIGDRWARDTAFLSGALRRVRTDPASVRSRPTAALGQVDNFSHLLLETVPRALRVLECAPDVEFVVDREVPTFAAGILEWLGIRWTREPVGSTLACSAAWLCESQPMFRPHPADVTMLRERLVPLAGGSVATGGRLYVSRTRSSRSIRDEQRLADHLATRGFVEVHCEDLPFAEQVALFASAEAAIGPHGAGLSNAVFMRPGGTVAEFSTGAWWFPTVRFVSSGAGHAYSYIPLTATSEAPGGSAEQAINGVEAVLARLGS